MGCVPRNGEKVTKLPKTNIQCYVFLDLLARVAPDTVPTVDTLIAK
jgi:hypothetical protein